MNLYKIVVTSLAVAAMSGLMYLQALAQTASEPSPESRYGMSGLVFSSDGKLLARTATEKKVPIWSTKTGKLIGELPTEAHDASFSSDGKWFATGFTDDKQALAIWERFAKE